MNKSDFNEHLKEKGWAVCDFPQTSLVYETREMLCKQLASILGKPVSLEHYHEAIQEDGRHTQVQSEITEFYRQGRFGPRIMEQQLPLLEVVIGLDISVQAHPYLRITRPGKPQDNIGYHRDTFYGGSPYELSVLVPFVDIPEKSSLLVLSGSHTMPEEAFPTVQIASQDVSKNSQKHNLGFLYAPKLMEPSIEEKMEPVPLKLGQALFFHLSLVHGSVENRGDVTRWSSDIRIMNPFAPVDLSQRPAYYQPLRLSPVSQSAQNYLRSNGL